jgi:hypothetical protein
MDDLLTKTHTPTKREALASDFRKEFYREFETTEKANGPTPNFEISVARFDEFLVLYGYLENLPDDTEGTVRQGLIYQRNALRSTLNGGSTRGLHGSPVYSVEVAQAGVTLVVNLEVQMSVSAVPDTLNGILKYSGNRMRELERDHAFMMGLDLPQFAKDRMSNDMRAIARASKHWLEMLAEMGEDMNASKVLALAAAAGK